MTLSKPLHVIAALGSAQTLAYGSTYYLPAILSNSIAAELGVSTVWVFLCFSAGLLVSGALSPAAGRLIDLYGGRRVLAGSSIAFAAGLAMLGASTGPATLMASWLVIGAGMGTGSYEAAFSALAGIYGSNARRSITGITLIAGFASTICWPISAYMDVTIGWRGACYVWALCHVLIGLPLNLLLPKTRHVEKHDAEAPTSVPPAGRMAVLCGLSFVFAATWFCSTAMAAHLPRLLQDAGASLPAAIAAAALVGPAQVAARWLEFGLMRNVHPLVSARIASLTHPVGAAGLLAVGAPAATFFTVAHGAGNGVMTIAMGTLPLRLFGAAGFGLRQGLLMVPARILQASAPFLFDLLLSRYGNAALLLTSALGVAAFIVLSAIPVAQRPRARMRA